MSTTLSLGKVKKFLAYHQIYIVKISIIARDNTLNGQDI